MRPSWIRTLVVRLTVVAAVLFVVCPPVAAQTRPDPDKFKGPQCFATVLPQVDGSVGRVKAGREPSMQIFGAGDAVFITPEGTGVRAGETYLLYRVDGRVHHPATNDVIGDAVNLLGQIEIIQVSDDLAMGRITNSCMEIEPGDHLHAPIADGVAGDVDFPPLDPDFLVNELDSDAFVVHGHSESLLDEDSLEREGLNNWETYLVGDLVTIDQGTTAGWNTDARVLFYTTRPEAAAPDDRQRTDPVVQAQGLVIYALDTTAVVMITDGGGTVRIGSRARAFGDTRRP